MHAAKAGHYTIVVLLLLSGADVNAKQKSGKVLQLIANFYLIT